MERCFIIEKDSKLGKDYQRYAEITEENTAKLKSFVSENITKEKYAFAQNSDTLQISLTEEEAKMFAPQLKKDYFYSGERKIYTFKKYSDIGKAYTKLNIKACSRPLPGWYTHNLYDARTRLFDLNNVIYCTIESNQLRKDNQMPDGWKEIKLSEFYKIIEDDE